jgi:type IV secretion system protein TrbF
VRLHPRLRASRYLLLQSSAAFATKKSKSGRDGSTVTPRVIEVDRLGQAQAVSAATADYRPTDPQIAWHLARFIGNVRGIPADPVIVPPELARGL